MLVQEFYPKMFIKMLENGFMEIVKMGKTGESMNSYFPSFLSISLDMIIVQAPSIPHFKDLGMKKFCNMKLEFASN